MKNTIKCIHCLDSGGKCNHCLSSEQFIAVLETAAYQAASENKKGLEEALNRILFFLPENPVMAMLEAESDENITDNLVCFIRQQFNVRKFV